MRIHALVLATGLALAPCGVALADEALFLPVESLVVLDGKLNIKGVIERGSIKQGDKVDVVAIGPTVSGTVGDIFHNMTYLQEASAGTSVQVEIKGVNESDMRRGRIIVWPGAQVTHSKVTVKVKMSSTESFRLVDKADIRVKVGMGNVEGVASMTEDALPGDEVTVPIDLRQTLAVAEGDLVTLRHDGREVAAGVVMSVAD